MQIRLLTAKQLTKEEEAAAGGEDMEVRREDQEKINKFSSLHQKETALEEELRAKIVSAAQATSYPSIPPYCALEVSKIYTIIAAGCQLRWNAYAS